MTVKTFSLGLLIAVLASITTAGLTVVSMSKSKSEGSITRFFNSPKKSEVEFVEIKNVIITLKSSNVQERYLLIELALVTDDPKNIKRIENMAPAIRGATVSLLSGMEYNDVRRMDIKSLSEKLMASYAAHFKSLDNPLPFKDAIISKMVFQ